MDLLEYPLVVRSPSKAGVSDRPSNSGHTIGRFGLQPARESETKEGSSHPDRDAQFRYIHGRVEEFQGRGQPVVSVDTKKKELVGDFKNGGREWRPAGNPESVRVYDFVDKALGKLIPMAYMIR